MEAKVSTNLFQAIALCSICIQRESTNIYQVIELLYGQAVRGPLDGKMGSRQKTSVVLAVRKKMTDLVNETWRPSSNRRMVQDSM